MVSTAHLTANWLFLVLSMAMTVEEPTSAISIEDNVRDKAIIILLPAPPHGGQPKASGHAGANNIDQR